MEDKSKNKNSHAGDRLSGNQPSESLPDSNPVNPAFYTADDPRFGSDSTTGSGYSEAERGQHDGHSPGIPADPNDAD